MRRGPPSAVLYCLALRTVAAVLMCVGAVACAAPAHAQAAADLSNVAACALPTRYSMASLVADLRWNQIPYSPATVAQAHARYADVIDALLPSCVPFAASVAQGSNMTYGVRLADPELARLQAHQRRLAAATEAAEAQLFTELAAAPDLTDDARLKLGALRARRSLERIIDGTQRRCALRGQAHVPIDAARACLSQMGLERAEPELRARIVAAIDACHADRMRAWTSVDGAVDASAAETVAAQRDEPPPQNNSYATPPDAPLPGPAQALLLRTEIETLRVAAKAAPEVARRLQREERIIARQHGVAREPIDELPAIAGVSQSSVAAVVQAIAGMPQWDAPVRASLRPILADWLQADSELAAKELDAYLRALASSADGYASAFKDDPSARAALARAKLGELAARANVSWLAAGQTIPRDTASQIPPSAEDARDFGGDLPSPEVVDAAPQRESVSGRSGRFMATLGMIPAPWRNDERASALERLQLNDTQLQVARQIFADANADWARDVEPLAQDLRALHARRVAIKDGDTKARLALLIDLEAAHAKRRTAWEAARVIDERLFAGLALALGETGIDGRNYLLALRLVRLREAGTEGCMALLSAMLKTNVPDVASVALQLRGTTEERSLVLGAIAAQANDFLSSRAAEWDAELRVQEESEHVERRHAERTLAATSTGDRVQANEESGREIRAMYAGVDELVVRMRVLDDALLGRMQAALPELLANRLRRAVRVMGATPELTRVEGMRLDVLYAVSQIHPEALPAADAAFNAALDPWEAWAEPVLQEIDRKLPPSAQSETHDWNSTAAKRAAVVRFVLLPSLTDRMDHALCATSFAVPRDIALRIAWLARFAPPLPAPAAR